LGEEKDFDDKAKVSLTAGPGQTKETRVTLVRRSQAGISIVMISLTSLVAPGVAASASINSSSGGSNPNSVVCKAFHTAIKANSSQTLSNTTLDSQFKKAAEAGNFALAKKDLVSIWVGSTRGAQRIQASLSRAPDDVRAAEASVVTFFGQIEKIAKGANVKSASSAVQINDVESNPKFTAAERTVSRYVIGQCGSSNT
jgi:hypothetical protein